MRIISNTAYQTRVLTGLRERLLSTEAVALYVAEYRAESERRSRDDVKRRAAFDRKVAAESTKIERLVNAIAEGAATFGDFRERLEMAKTGRDAYEAELAQLNAERVVVLHPNIAARYGSEVEALQQTLSNGDSAEVQNEAIPRLRALIGSIVLVPASIGRGVDITVTGMLTNMLEPDPKVVEQYQYLVIQPSLQRDGGSHGMDWYCPART